MFLRWQSEQTWYLSRVFEGFDEEGLDELALVGCTSKVINLLLKSMRIFDGFAFALEIRLCLDSKLPPRGEIPAYLSTPK